MNAEQIAKGKKFFKKIVIILICTGFGLTIVGGLYGGPKSYLIGIMLVIAAIPFTGFLIYFIQREKALRKQA